MARTKIGSDRSTFEKNGSDLDRIGQLLKKLDLDRIGRPLKRLDRIGRLLRRLDRDRIENRFDPDPIQLCRPLLLRPLLATHEAAFSSFQPTLLRLIKR